MESAELEVEDEHARGRLGADDVAGELEGVHGGVAAHKADHGALDRRAQAEVVDDLEIEPRGIKAGAGGDDQVSDGAAFGGGQSEAIEGATRQGGSSRLVDPHAVRGRRKAATLVERAAVKLRAEARVRGVEREYGVAVRDAGARGYATEQLRGAFIVQQGRAKLDEGLVDVVRGNSSADAIDVGGGGCKAGGAICGVLAGEHTGLDAESGRSRLHAGVNAETGSYRAFWRGSLSAVRTSGMVCGAPLRARTFGTEDEGLGAIGAMNPGEIDGRGPPRFMHQHSGSLTMSVSRW